MKNKKLSDKDIDKILRETAAEDLAASLNEKDVEFLKSIGVNTDLETLRKNFKEEWIKRKG